MTTAEERKARREERLRKEMLRQKMCLALWSMLKYIGAVAGMMVASIWLAVVMWDYAGWAMTISWAVASMAIGAVLLHEAGK